MYSGLLPKDLTEDDLSPDEGEDEQEEDGERTCERSPGESNSGVKQSIPESTNKDHNFPTCGLPGVSKEMWQKFQDLRRKNDETKAIKVPRKRIRRRKKGMKSEEPAQTSREQLKEQEHHWNELKQYFGVNDRFHPPACSSPPPKSGLEKSIERAIAEGDIAKAEEMSDRLATRELGVNIAQAVECRDFVRRKTEEEASQAAKRRKKEIAWGFEAKKRWETKSNMGFM
ncbi:protein FAM204A isoform X1 [Takifugu flavidus]|uniref:Protein FAM204A n=2 Tax=Takifugu TaxID=31032 RepID=A0A5C6PIP5_9TELE|nr:protein FAM204A isoform X1 [Takifugu flavidus]TNM99725.1 hypothetical protein fugu_012758 [Takifugu bimaculatus]TWW78100.1 Protein FAM204A [Takifugu flavidus]